jgi:hypothetical protein
MAQPMESSVDESQPSYDLVHVPQSTQRSLIRASVIEFDLLMYSAIVGQVPQIAPLMDSFLAPPPEQFRQDRPEPTWSPFVLSFHLRAAYRQNPLLLATPEIAA